MNISQIGFPQTPPSTAKTALPLSRPLSFDASFQQAETFTVDTRRAERPASRHNEAQPPERKAGSRPSDLKEKNVTPSRAPASGRKAEREDPAGSESDRTAISRDEEARPEAAGADGAFTQDASPKNETDTSGEKTAATDEPEDPSSQKENQKENADATKKAHDHETGAAAPLKATALKSGLEDTGQVPQTPGQNRNAVVAATPSAAQIAQPPETPSPPPVSSPEQLSQAKTLTDAAEEVPVQTTAAQDRQNAAAPHAAATIAPPWQPPTGKGETSDFLSQQGDKGTHAVLETMLAQKNGAASSQGDTHFDLLGNGHGANRQTASLNNASGTTAAFTLPDQPPAPSPAASLSQPGAFIRPGAALPVPDSHIANQVIEHLATNPLKGKSSIRIRLEPAELGQLKMELQVSKDQVTVHLLADNRQAQEALLHQIDRLRDTLAQQGLTLGDVSVSTRDGQNNDTNSNHRAKRTGDDALKTAQIIPDEELPNELLPGSTYELGHVSLRI